MLYWHQTRSPHKCLSLSETCRCAPRHPKRQEVTYHSEQSTRKPQNAPTSCKLLIQYRKLVYWVALSDVVTNGYKIILCKKTEFIWCEISVSICFYCCFMNGVRKLHAFLTFVTTGPVHKYKSCFKLAYATNAIVMHCGSPTFGVIACMNIMKERDRGFNLCGDEIWMGTHPNG